MDDAPASIARRAATRLTARLDAQLPDKVERALAEDPLERSPERFVDPISIGLLIVGLTGLGWTVYHDLKKDRAAPTDPRDFARRVADALREQMGDRIDGLGTLTTEDKTLLVDVVAEETVAAGDGRS